MINKVVVPNFSRGFPMATRGAKAKTAKKGARKAAKKTFRKAPKKAAKQGAKKAVKTAREENCQTRPAGQFGLSARHRAELLGRLRDGSRPAPDDHGAGPAE